MIFRSSAENFIFFGKLLAVTDRNQGHSSRRLSDDESNSRRFLFDAPENSIHLLLYDLNNGAFLLIIITALERFRDEAAHVLYELVHVIAEYLTLPCRKRDCDGFVPIGKIIDVAPIIRSIAFFCQPGDYSLDVGTLSGSRWTGNEKIL